MKNLSFKFAFVVALLVSVAGLQFGAEARNLSHPCSSNADCDPSRCHCDLNQKLCICNGAEKESIAQALKIGHNGSP